jgi:hypothetical protein
VIERQAFLFDGGPEVAGKSALILGQFRDVLLEVCGWRCLLPLQFYHFLRFTPISSSTVVHRQHFRLF